MAYPWSANDILTAADLNDAINNKIVTTGLTLDTYTPTLTQSATVTKTVEYASYHTVAGITHVAGSLAVTGAGTAANQVVIGLPPVAPNSFRVIGEGAIYDASAGSWYIGTCIWLSSTTFKIQSATAGGNGLGAVAFTAGLANLDIVAFQLQYH